MEARRVRYIDWLRVLAVLLLFPFHTGRVFNADEPFYVKGPELSTPLGYVLSFIDAWHMPLLFFLAGSSTFFALRKRSTRQYAFERVRRLLVPLGFGLLVLIPPQTWYGGRFNSGYEDSFVHYMASGEFLEWNLQDGGDYYGGFGFGHLWFVLFLIVISLLVLPLWRGGDRADARRVRTSRLLSRPVGWLLAAFVILVAEGLPALGGKNLAYYTVFFVLGYLAMSSPDFMDAAERRTWFTLAAGVALGVWWTASWRFRHSLPDPSLALAGVNVLGMMARWLIIVGLMGAGRRYLDRSSRALAYLGEASYPIYILHQTVIVVLAFYVVGIGAVWPVQALVLLVGGVVGTLLAYECVRRFEWLRLLFGMRPRDRRARTAPLPGPPDGLPAVPSLN